MATFKEGDRVRIVSREQTEEDQKSGMYYNHYAGLTGTVQKVYSKTEVTLDIELESLSREIRKRHDEVRDQMKTKWLDSLSEDGRSKLTEREKDFVLRYVVLVKMDDMEKAGARPASVAKPVPAPIAPEPAAPVTQTRLTLAEIEAAEIAELARRAQK